MFCPRCGRKAIDRAAFCFGCGSALPARSPTLLEIGYGYLEAGEVEMAVAALNRALAEAPDDPRAILGLAVAQIQRRDWEAAEAALRRTLELDAANAVAHAYLGSLLMAQFEIDAARAELDEALRLDPASFIVHLKRGEFFLRLGLVGEAVAELASALALPAPSSQVESYARSLLAQARERSRGSFVRRVAPLDLATVRCTLAGLWPGMAGRSS